MGDMDSAIAVIGAGTMGVGIAYVFAATGATVHVVEPDEGRSAGLHVRVAGAAAEAVRRGKLDEGGARSLAERIVAVPSVGDLPNGLALIVESVPEDVELKGRVLLAAEARSPAILATNTSSISIDELAAGLARPEAFLGLHFFNPVWSIRLVEVINGQHTSSTTLAAARSLIEGLGKESIVVRDVPGFATSRLDLISALEAMRMLEDGVASAEDIDRAAVLAYRHPIGPLRLSDVVGLDVRLDIARSLMSRYGERYAPPEILVKKVASGDLGEKSGRGFFDWT
ncbi:MAG: 3-hydroxyacyl-CoA dehydrogenase family protein [Acidimicrobiales bacterium]